MRIIILLVLTIAGIASAQSKEALANEILEAQKIDATVKQMLAQMQAALGQQLETSMKSQLPPNVDRAAAVNEMKEFQQKLFAKIGEQLTPEKIKPSIAQIYVDEFSIEELRAIRDFQKSPAGQAMIRKQPAIAVKSVQAGQQLIQGILPELQRMGVEWAEQMKKKYGGE